MHKKYWRYQKLLLSKALEEFKSHFEKWPKLIEPFAIGFFTFVASVVWLYKFKGGIVMSDIGIIIISTISGPALYVIYIFLAKWAFSSYSVYKKQRLEIEALNFDDVEFSTTQYSVLGNKGWGIRVTNNKETTICVSAWLSKIRTSKTEFPRNRNALLGVVFEKEDRLNFGYLRLKGQGGSGIIAVTVKDLNSEGYYILCKDDERFTIEEEIGVGVNFEANTVDPQNDLWLPSLMPINLRAKTDGTAFIRSVNGEVAKE